MVKTREKQPKAKVESTRKTVKLIDFYPLCQWAKGAEINRHTTLGDLAQRASLELGKSVGNSSMKQALKAVGREVPGQVRHSIKVDNALLAQSIVRLYELCGYAENIPPELAGNIKK